MKGNIVVPRRKSFADSLSCLMTTEFIVVHYGEDEKGNWLLALKTTGRMKTGQYEGEILGYFVEAETEEEMVDEFKGTFK
jgi:subtilisin-like proprotein convertase family protein